MLVLGDCDLSIRVQALDYIADGFMYQVQGKSDAMSVVGCYVRLINSSRSTGLACRWVRVSTAGYVFVAGTMRNDCTEDAVFSVLVASQF